MPEKQGGMKSRKLWVAIAGLVVILIIAIIAIVKEIEATEIKAIIASIAGLVSAYVIGQGYADGQAVKKGGSG